MDNTDNVDNEREELIRRRAYVIWEQEGRPEGQHQRHWEQAAREMQGPEMQGEESEVNEKAAPGGVRTNGSKRREKQTAPENDAFASPAEGSAAPPPGGER